MSKVVINHFLYCTLQFNMVSGFMKSQFLTPNELAEMMKISKTTVYRMIDKRQLPFYKMGGSLRFRMDEIMAYIEECRIEPTIKLYEHT